MVDLLLVVVVVSVVSVVMEEEPLRSDTRLPLESSPYMAGNLYNDQLAARSNAFLFPFSTVTTYIKHNASQTIENRFEFLGSTGTIRHFRCCR